MRTALLITTFITLAAISYGAAFLRDYPHLPTFEEEMAETAVPGALECGTGMQRTVDWPRGNMGMGLAGAEAVNACTVRAWKAKRPFTARFDTLNASDRTYGLCGNARGEVFFMSKVWHGVRRCEHPHVTMWGKSQIIGCADGAECPLIMPGG